MLDKPILGKIYFIPLQIYSRISIRDEDSAASFVRLLSHPGEGILSSFKQKLDKAEDKWVEEFPQPGGLEVGFQKNMYISYYFA